MISIKVPSLNKSPSLRPKSPTPSVKPSPSIEVKKYSTPLPYVPKKACEHVWAEAFNVRTGKSYKRCLYCKERIEEVKTRIVRIKL